MNILIADDHVIFREGLAALLPQIISVKKVFQAATGKEAVALYSIKELDVILMDIDMPEMNGVEATREIKKDKSHHTAIIALTMFNRYADILDLYDAGIDGYLLKDSTAREVVKAIQMVKEGKEYYCAAVQETLFTALIKRQKRVITDKDNPLTDREEEILQLICKQFSTEEIAGKLFISPLTVNNHRRSILEKTKCKNVAGMVIYALQHGIYSIPEPNAHSSGLK